MGDTPHDGDSDTSNLVVAPLDNDDIGTIGQDAFKLWCSQRRIGALLAVKDKFGWDYYLQWAHAGDLLDPPELSCKVQVKTSAAGATSASIKLSNWKRMALEHGPWFVAAIALSGVEVSSAHLVHVDEQLVRNVVERLGTVPQGKALHEIHMSVRWRDENRLPSPFYDGLYDALMVHIGSSEAAYREKKKAWIDAARRATAPSYEGTFKIDAPTDENAGDLLSRLAVGLIEEVPIKEFKAVLKRFGQTVPAEQFDDAAMAAITLPNRKPDRQTRITLFNRERSENVAFNLDTFTTATVFPWLPKQHQRIRFVGSMISFMWRFLNDNDATFTASFTIPSADTSATLSELARVCHAARMFAEAQTNGLFASLEPGSTNKAPALDLSATPAPFDPEFLDFARVAEEAALLARVFDLDTSAIILRPSELMKRRFAIRMFAGGLDRSLSQVDLRVGIQPTEPVSGKKAALVVPTIVPLGSYVIVGAFTLAGIADWKQMADGTGTMGITDAEVKLRFKQVVARDRWDGDAMKVRVDALAETLEGEGVEVVVNM